MSPANAGTPTAAGFRFTPQAGIPGYVCRNDHRPHAGPARNRWSISPDEEWSVFAEAHLRGVSSRLPLWGLKPDLAVIGLEERRIAKFPHVSNPHDDWHGYPVSARDPKRELEHRPPTQVTKLWLDLCLITLTQKARIDRGKI